MDSNTLHSICQQIYRRFPALAGTRPRQQPAAANTLLIFEVRPQLGKAISLPFIVRVTVHPTGKILKISSSR
ncbi:MAG: hypothetical protein KA988_01480 [Longilinea sp.]|nr:hypothetical protein [Longilinea sp.]MCA1954429.1 hypothetical protein [Anaerolinea sp.]